MPHHTYIIYNSTLSLSLSFLIYFIISLCMYILIYMYTLCYKVDFRDDIQRIRKRKNEVESVEYQLFDR